VYCNAYLFYLIKSARNGTNTKQTFEKFIQIENLIIFICTGWTEKFGFLHLIEKNELITEHIIEGEYPSGKKWRTTDCYIKNLDFADEFCLDDFHNGYCLSPEVWETQNAKVLLLYYYH